MDQADKDTIAQLKEEIAELKYIVSMTPGNVYWKDLTGRYLGCNKNLSEMLHLSSPDEIIGLTDKDLLELDTAEHIIEIDTEVLRSNKEKVVEEYGIDADKNPAVYLTVKTPLYDPNGKIKGLMGISFDITERKKMEEKLRIAKQKADAANRAKSQFLATISHELRTPLTSILGFSSMLEQTHLADTLKKEYNQHIINSGTYLLSLINSLLDYNKLETNKYELVHLPLNLKELTVHTINMLSGAAKLKSLPLLLEYEDDVPQQVMSNNRALRQILINLIGNAIKFTDRGQILISVRCLEKNNKNATLRISVQDTGVGIPPKEQQSIFRRFYQTGNIYTRNASLTGTGLGLAIVKKLVKLIGGKIAVNSTPNAGSEFYFIADFPIVSSKETPWLPFAATVKILVAQDDHPRNYIHTLLANSFYEVVSPRDTLNQLLAAQQSMRPYDIVMIDNNAENERAMKLFDDILNHSNIHQPLIILLTDTLPTAEEEQLFPEIILKPAALDVKIFQTELKLAWEKWLLNIKRKMLLLKPPKNPYVLLIEDNALIQIIHKAMLEDLGCKVDVADSAKNTFPLLENKYDILLIDIGLPDMAGFELIKKIRQEEQRGGQIPIIVLTGYSEEEERQLCLRVGANEVAVKPISKNNLKKILERYIN
jgi:two-component system, sensor histidine kinase and response regulator